MKKVITTLVAVAFLFTVSSAQFLNIGVGVNFSAMCNFDDATEESWNYYFQGIGSPEMVTSIENHCQPGFQAGASANFGIGDQFCFHPGLQLSMQQGKASGTYAVPGGGTEVEFSSQQKITLIALPLMMQYKLGDFYIELGPQVGFVLSGTFVETENGIEYDPETNTEDLNTIDFSVGGGLGYLFGDSGVGAFARQTIGLTPVAGSDQDHYDTKFTNSVTSIGLFYRFNLGDDEE